MHSQNKRRLMSWIRDHKVLFSVIIILLIVVLTSIVVIPVVFSQRGGSGGPSHTRPTHIKLKIFNNSTTILPCVGKPVTIFYNNSNITMDTNQISTVTINQQWSQYVVGIQFNGLYARQHPLPGGRIFSPSYAQNPDNAGANLFINEDTTFDVFPIDLYNIYPNSNQVCDSDRVRNQLMVKGQKLTDFFQKVHQPPQVTEPESCTFSPSSFDFISMEIRRVDDLNYELKLENLVPTRQCVTPNCCGWSSSDVTSTSSCDPVNPIFRRPPCF